MSTPGGATGRRHARALARGAAAAAAGLAAALLVSCGSSSKGLIPVANAGPLRIDFEEVERAAQNGGGSCAATEAALAKMFSDFAALPGSVDRGLRNTLHQGMENLQRRAKELCAQPLTTTSTTGTTTTRTTTTPATTTTTTPATTPTVTAPTTSTPTTTPTTTTPPAGQGGGTAAPGQEGLGEGAGAGGAAPGESK
jgi:hypothetical protein